MTKGISGNVTSRCGIICKLMNGQECEDFKACDTAHLVCPMVSTKVEATGVNTDWLTDKASDDEFNDWCNKQQSTPLTQWNEEMSSGMNTITCKQECSHHDLFACALCKHQESLQFEVIKAAEVDVRTDAQVLFDAVTNIVADANENLKFVQCFQGTHTGVPCEGIYLDDDGYVCCGHNGCAGVRCGIGKYDSEAVDEWEEYLSNKNRR